MAADGQRNVDVICCVCGLRKGRGNESKEWRRKPEKFVLRCNRSRASNECAIEICSKCRRENSRELENLKQSEEELSERRTRQSIRQGFSQ
jgi:hypothetical protein